MEWFIAVKFNGNPKRIKIYIDNGEIYDIPKIAEEHLNITI